MASCLFWSGERNRKQEPDILGGSCENMQGIEYKQTFITNFWSIVNEFIVTKQKWTQNRPTEADAKFTVVLL